MAPVRVAATILAAVEAAQVGPVHQRSAVFDDYLKQHNKDYAVDSEEYAMRSALFHERLALVQTHNAIPESDGRLWTAVANKLADRTQQELSQLRGWRNIGGGAGSGGGLSLLASDAQTTPPESKLPEHVDWRSLAFAADVPDQGACGSCWAVATVSMLQGRTAVQLKENRTYSAQQLVNCVPNPKECGGTGGCSGATVELAMAYVEEAGLSSAEEELYKGQDLTCKQPASASLKSSMLTRGEDLTSSMGFSDNALVGASFIQLNVGRASKKRDGNSIGLRAWHKLPSNKALPLLHALTEGPVAISVAAEPWFLYGGGIFNNCDKDVVIDHAVTLFGYGVEEKSGDKVAYWLVRNSWGKDWGEGGFIKLFRQAKAADEEAYCGTDHDPKAGINCKPYPEKVEVCGMCGMLFDSVAAHFGEK
eukprot:TRINITY_DN38386_c0_g1_i1.p1 TRINITY_DN38386_c0_g1~~TRINITY_DN38386_c0_g1_i1.p1  ORF type:complete len:421 (-),score=85.00 TRINITY_DN38386_c0_g1_i1:103-1365(-)